jgi:hypothetical protein
MSPYKKPISRQKYWILRDSKKNQLPTCSKESIITPPVFLFFTPSDSESGFANGIQVVAVALPAVRQRLPGGHTHHQSQAIVPGDL